MESAAAASHTAAGARPMVGAISVSGRQRVMEDAISIRPNLCSTEINSWRTVDFFAIYDGHGGRHVNPTVASLCSERMHVILEEELNADRSGSSSSRGERRRASEGQRTEEAWKRVLRSCFLRMDEMASCTCPECGTVGYQCGCPPDTLSLTGSTAVVTILTDETIIVANCGDLRAVLSHGGSAIPLSYDHKPDRQEERARIEACGGQVVFADGARVEGILAMSRAIGDNYLKPYMTSEPEITFTKREPEDECLILASDGLWDVLSSVMACAVARECLREEEHSFSPWVEGVGEGAMFSSRSASAAALLTRFALGRNSCDNISVIVVDLKRNHTVL
ncbi:probable protein phosphatase 2C 75 isoform X1 [Nicotiana tomentosiformis]|uniref:probable protein phosphatase 2C 75 isoform X1 n=1 Tax=Nicotiana tomentosiformis TaxID=4098 RepID=UPI00051ABC7C|nr:probable protein phosphatase 2C 75 isoform X1 [Nicotiana tomentosiformis]